MISVFGENSLWLAYVELCYQTLPVECFNVLFHYVQLCVYLFRLPWMILLVISEYLDRRTYDLHLVKCFNVVFYWIGVSTECLCSAVFAMFSQSWWCFSPLFCSSKSTIPVWPFVILSCFGGAYALIPYFVLWKPPAPPVEESELKRWPLSFLESKLTAGVRTFFLLKKCL